MTERENDPDYEHRVEVSRVTVGYVSRRNGAWLVQHGGPGADDMTHDELYDCASSAVVAKRIARKWAEASGFTGPFRWTPTNWGWTLQATHTEEWDRYVGD